MMLGFIRFAILQITGRCWDKGGRIKRRFIISLKNKTLLRKKWVAWDISTRFETPRLMRLDKYFVSLFFFTLGKWLLVHEYSRRNCRSKKSYISYLLRRKEYENIMCRYAKRLIMPITWLLQYFFSSTCVIIVDFSLKV